MNVAVAVTFVYAVLMLVGGVMGLVKGHSQISLILGGASAIIAALAGVLMLRGVKAGIPIAAVLALLLLVFGAKSWLLDGKPFMPRGLICVLSAVELIAVLLAARAA